jgi:hypothetical protein
MRGAGARGPAAMALPALEGPGPGPASGVRGPNGKGRPIGVDPPGPNVSVRNDRLRRVAVLKAAVLTLDAPRTDVPKDGPQRRAPEPPASIVFGPRKGGPWIGALAATDHGAIVLVVIDLGAAGPLGPGRKVGAPSAGPAAVVSSAVARPPAVPSAPRTAAQSAPVPGVVSGNQAPASPRRAPMAMAARRPPSALASPPPRT